MEIDREKLYWLKQEDHNIAFFHGFASKRCRTNNINGLRNSEG